jgi:hypothetical protein
MTADLIALYSRAILAHIDIHSHLQDGNLEGVIAAHRTREATLDSIERVSGHLKGRAFARVVILARDAIERGTR